MSATDYRKAVSSIRRTLAKMSVNDRRHAYSDIVSDASSDPDAMKDMRDRAESILRAEYWQHVRDLGESIVGECRKGEIADTKALCERIHEDCDGDSWVIYTAKAMDVLRYSDNSGRYAEEYGTDGLTEGGDIAWSRLAYAALEGDLMERIGADLDVNDPESWKPEEEEAAE
jgi:hypothetical protein